MAPQVAILVSSFQRPQHLARVLASIERQDDVDGRMEVVVTDDGSIDSTREVVERFASRVTFPVQLTSHTHQGYQLARCRNEGVAVSDAPYLLFLDGDCVIPPDHVRVHLERRQVGAALGGYCCLMDRETTQELTVQDIYESRYLERVDPLERQKLKKMAWRAQFYNWLHHPTKPKLFGGNIGIHRSDYERINGYDENFRGWGCEDDDLRLRLRAAGIKVRSILRWTCTYHLWHPRGDTTPSVWKEGANVSYLQRKDRPTYCANGVSKYRDGSASVLVTSWGSRPARDARPAA